ncbi:hypothetical protein AMS68_003020 [Peltaster fructicola]|uniref:AMP-dependent synthetase/ligase domain-containing protein n=1 Tax=Peltaster fructicola TaxID=286661 RepID=A0A6H0XS15_9PEZI|nr:hypothetical protein AMS68_003020 [Peltaster fructicola]
MITTQRSPFFEAIQSHDQKSVAVVHSDSQQFTYGTLLQDVAATRNNLLQATGKDNITDQRVAFMVENGYSYIVTLLSILAADAIAVPLAPSFPTSELRYIIDHSEALAVLASSKHGNHAKEALKEVQQQPVYAELSSPSGKRNEAVQLSSQARGGMMLYTSGTTARPKGVLLPQQTLAAQALSLIEAWKYTSKDHLLHVLPLHHIHGIVNALLTPLMAGSSIEFDYPFSVDRVWKRFAAPLSTTDQKPITFFTVVPTIWARMLQAYPKLTPDVQIAAKRAINRENLRLNISGSAALPKPTRDAWTTLSGGNVLLERFGMTEVGMALSCGLDDADRVDGSVGWPLPSVEARLVDSDTNEIIPIEQEERQGEVQLRGPTVFKEYWRNPEATKKEFTEDGWFKTGDIALRKQVPGSGEGKSGAWATGPAYFIQGRKSADIIKTGGEKVSALEIERELLSLPEVEECAVVGLPSETWGQKVAAVVVLTTAGKTAGKNGKPWGALDMRRALKDKLVAYKIPQDLKVVDSIPRNAMGKVNKKQLVPALFGEVDQIRRRSVEVQAEREAARRAGG